MIFRHSLRTRIIIAFCLFGAVLGLVYATAVYISFVMVDVDRIVSRRMEEVLDFIAQSRRFIVYPRA